MTQAAAGPSGCDYYLSGCTGCQTWWCCWHTSSNLLTSPSNSLGLGSRRPFGSAGYSCFCYTGFSKGQFMTPWPAFFHKGTSLYHLFPSAFSHRTSSDEPHLKLSLCHLRYGGRALKTTALAGVLKAAASISKENCSTTGFWAPYVEYSWGSAVRQCQKSALHDRAGSCAVSKEACGLATY